MSQKTKMSINEILSMLWIYIGSAIVFIWCVNYHNNFLELCYSLPFMWLYYWQESRC